MANFCNFEIRVKGKRGNALLVYASMPAVDECPVTYSAGTDNHYEIHFHGCTKWSVNFDVTDDWDGRDIDVDLNTLSDRDIHALGNSLWGYSLKAKSRVLACEILVCYWSDESDFNQFDHYVNGICVKQRKMSYFPDEAEFDWDTLEFENHEGEYDETIVGDRLGEIVMGNVMSEFQHMGNPTHHLVDDYEGLINLKELFTKVAAELDDEDDEDEYDEDEDDSPAWADQYTSKELFDWKFTQGNHYEGDGWSVAIPDGFCKWEGLYADSDSDVIFVPELYRFEPDIRHNPAPVCVFANTRSTPTPSMLFPEMSRVFHRFARIGYSVMLNKLFAEEEDTISDIHPFATDDFNGTMALTNLDDGSLGVDVAILSEKTMHLVKIFAQQIPEEDIDSFIRSLEKWFETYQNPGNEYKIEQILEDQDQCIGQLLNDDISCIEQAVKQCILEYNLSVNGRTQCLEYRCENEFVPAYEVEEQAKQILKDAFEVKRYFVERLDDFLEHANQYEISKDTMCQVYGKLLELEQSTEGGRLNIGGNEYHIKSPMPLSLRLKFKRWQEVADELTHTDSPAAYTSSLGLQAVHEAEQKHAQWLEKYSDAISDQPDITIPGKKFVFTGLGVMKHDQQNHPAVQNLMAHGGLYRSSVSGVTDYLVVGKVDPGEAKIRDAIAQQKAGKPIQIIRLEDLEAILLSNSTDKHEHRAAEYELLDTSLLPEKASASNCLDLKEETEATDPLLWLPEGEQPQFTIENGVLLHTLLPQNCTELVIPDGVEELASRALFPADVGDDFDLPEYFMWGGNESIFSSIQKITFPESLKRLAHGSLCYTMENVECITLPNGLEMIGDWAFSGWPLKEIVIPPSVSYIGCCAFVDCSDLESVTIQNPEAKVFCGAFPLEWLEHPQEGRFTLKLPHQLAYVADQYPAVHIDYFTADKAKKPPEEVEISFDPQNTLQGIYIPAGCSEVVVPEGTEELASDVFRGSPLESIVLPESLKKIGSNTFSYCSKLKEIAIPEGVTEIYHSVFSNCTQLSAVQLPKSLTKIGMNVFSNCNNLRRVIVLSDSLEARKYLDATLPFANWYIPIEEKTLSSYYVSAVRRVFFLSKEEREKVLQGGELPEFEDVSSDNDSLLSEVEEAPLEAPDAPVWDDDLTENADMTLEHYNGDTLQESTSTIHESEHVHSSDTEPPVTEPSGECCNEQKPIFLKPEPQPVVPSQKKEGCYIATAVYGSYDAPEVLVLRRFRDEFLQKIAIGRLFVRAYYALSPALAQKLHTAKHMNAFVRKGLNHLVDYLQDRYSE